MLHFWSAAFTLARRALRAALRAGLAPSVRPELRQARAIPVASAARSVRPAVRVR
jgi:hypothetical protein